MLQFNINNHVVCRVKIGDIAELLEWIVVNSHLTKKCDSYLRILQWLPTIHQTNIDLSLVNSSSIVEVKIQPLFCLIYLHLDLTRLLSQFIIVLSTLEVYPRTYIRM